MTELTVHVDLDGEPVAAGTAYVTSRRGRTSTAFVYAPEYLTDPRAYDLEPALPRRSGQHFVDGLPGSFTDCAPDRWGRNLIDKRRRFEQRRADQRLPDLTDVDYLVGVSDVSRQGALRFGPGGDVFLAERDDVPKLVSLPRLLAAADRVDARRSSDDDLAAVKALLDAGSGSLGGARPKASVRGDDGVLLIAKFPHRDDEWNVMAWEGVAVELARRAGLVVPRVSSVQVGGRDVLVAERFDRGPGGRRIGYISAMTLLEARDGDVRDYADIAHALEEVGASVTDDLHELFARVAFSVGVHNTDDHLRNHGFVRARGGWRLSPMFDVNPHPDLARRRVTSILGADGVDDEVEALADLARACRLSSGDAAAIVERVVFAVRGWRAEASRRGLSAAELDVFADVFETRSAALAAFSSPGP